MDRVLSGLSSGEGVIFHVRDSTDRDDGVGDKRLLIVEQEFAAAFKVMKREGNTLSVIIRQAWDNGNLRVMTRRDPLVATDAHISIVGHITKEELNRSLEDVDMFNGFANRFLWFCVKRSKLLPEGGQRPDMSDLLVELTATYEHARTVKNMVRDGATARSLWAEIYMELADSPPGLLGVVTSRAEAQMVRLSLLYALLDKRTTIGVEHLQAAKAVWDYAFASARYIFGRSTGDSLADKVLLILDAGPANKKDIYKALGGHASKNELDRALRDLETAGKAARRSIPTGGRPAEVWSKT